MRATKFAMSLGVIMVLGRGKSAKFNSRALLIEVYKKEIKRIQQFDHLMLWKKKGSGDEPGSSAAASRGPRGRAAPARCGPG